jgi:uncharacterized phiE125 gp8 family phage protein
MSLSVTTPAAVEPITTAEAKEWLRVDTGDTSQDVIIALLIKGVRNKFESHLRRSFITRTYSWEAESDDMSYGLATLPRPPIQSVTSLTTYDDSSGSEVATVTSTADYQLVEGSYVAARNDGWEVNRRDKAATIVYVAGYGDAATDIPEDIKMAMLEMLALRFERRGDEDRDAVTNREISILESVDHYRIIGY